MASAGTAEIGFVEPLVLVADDDESSRNTLRELGEASGFAVVLATNGLEALERIADRKPHLVLLDLVLPLKDGFSVLKWVRQDSRFFDLPVIALVSPDEIEQQRKSMELGADDVLTSPYKLVELRTRVRAALTVRSFRRHDFELEQRALEHAPLDPVTGAHVAMALNMSLAAELTRSRHAGLPLACLIVGFGDDPKVPTTAPPMWDELMKQLAQRIYTCLRTGDRLFRLESGEFAALLPETDRKGCQRVANRLLNAFANGTEHLAGGLASRTVRFGAAIFPSDRVRTGEQLLALATQSYREQRGIARAPSGMEP